MQVESKDLHVHYHPQIDQHRCHRQHRRIVPQMVSQTILAAYRIPMKIMKIIVLTKQWRHQ